MTPHPHPIEPSPPNPTRVPAGDHRWDEYWAGVANEDWLVARRLLDLSPRVRGFFASHLVDQSWPAVDEHGTPTGTESELVLDWSGAAGNVPREGFSATQRRLADLVLALVLDTLIVLSDLTWMGSWAVPVWEALVEWGTHGAATVKTTL